MMAPSESQSPNSSTPAAQAAADNLSEAYRQYVLKLEALPTFEEKIALGLQFMRGAISQDGIPRFREFWEARRNLLPFFKQNLNSAIRSQLWNEYVELTVEARRLKEILEEQSAFAMEQIDLAVQALSQDIANIDAFVEQSPSIVFPNGAQSIAQKSDVYNRIQRELNLLNTLASRLNGLRKEIMKTEMRIRFKTKFFKRLSEIGDHIFPKRKQLIEQISQEFEKDVSKFVESHFKGDEVVGSPYYALREEIKALQGFAKELTLNTGTFTKTRLKLSECWDKVKVLEKAHKQEFLQKKQGWTENRLVISAKLEELKTRLEGMDLRQVDAALDEIQKEMREIELGKDDVRGLRQEIDRIRAPYLEQIEQRRQDMERIEKEKLQIRKEKTASMKEKITELQKDEAMTAEELSEQLDEIRKTIEEIGLSKFEQQQFDRSLKPLKDLIAERKERALLSLSDDERQVLDQLKTVLEQRKVRRQEIKDQLEAHRKMLASSGLDFEKAMNLREQIEQEKERLDKANAGVLEIAQKIGEIEEKA